MKRVILPFIPEAVQPNHITVLRMLLTPIVLFLLSLKVYTIGVPLFVFAAFTDAVDGSLARVRNKITPWGMFFDPVADKVLIGSVALTVCLAYFHPWLVFLAIFLDLLPAMRWAVGKRQQHFAAANMWGKMKMFLQCTSVGLLLLALTLGAPVLIFAAQALLFIACAFAIVAVITYSL
jgi:CDP-diacylglycerol--glycerol-3-phosphate 3-phosphatidyltransferase